MRWDGMVGMGYGVGWNGWDKTECRMGWNRVDGMGRDGWNGIDGIGYRMAWDKIWDRIWDGMGWDGAHCGEEAVGSRGRGRKPGQEGL